MWLGHTCIGLLEFCPFHVFCRLFTRYDKYDAPVNTDKNKSDDPFMEVYEEVDEEVVKLMEVT